MAGVDTLLPETRRDSTLSLLLGTGFSLFLFVVMALAQLMGDVKAPKHEVEETLVHFTPPEIEELEEEEAPPPPDDDEPPPELDREPPQLTLAQLDVALNPGTGGTIVGDFALPAVGGLGTSQSLATEDFVDFADLDRMPRPIGVFGLDYPRRFLRKKVRGTIVLLLQLDETGKVLDVQVDSSDLPHFDAFVLSQVRKWRFTPPTQRGQPVKARARLPIPIDIS